MDKAPPQRHTNTHNNEINNIERLSQQLPSRTFSKPTKTEFDGLGTETVHRLSADYGDQRPNSRGGSAGTNFPSRKLHSAGRDAVGMSSDLDYRPRSELPPEPSPRPQLSVQSGLLAHGRGHNHVAENALLKTLGGGGAKNNDSSAIKDHYQSLSSTRDSYIDYSDFGL